MVIQWFLSDYSLSMLMTSYSMVIQWLWLVIQWLLNGYSLSMVMNSCSMVIQWLSVVMTIKLYQVYALFIIRFTTRHGDSGVHKTSASYPGSRWVPRVLCECRLSFTSLYMQYIYIYIVHIYIYIVYIYIYNLTIMIIVLIMMTMIITMIMMIRIT